MKSNKPTKQELELTAKLAEAMLDYFHFKITPKFDPIPVREWAETQGQHSDFESNQWWFEVDSDLGRTEVHQTDRFGWDILKMSKEIIYHAYDKLIGDGVSQEAIDNIFKNDNLWVQRLEVIKKEMQ